MKNFTTVLLLVFTLISFSQPKFQNEIVANGIAKTKINPDLGTFYITVSKNNSIEKTAISELNQEVAKVQKVLLKVGFIEKNIKIADYTITKDNYSAAKDFQATNSLAVFFVLDNQRIENFYQLMQSENLQDVNVVFSTSLSEKLEKSSREDLTQKAIANAKSYAENIAKSLNLKLLGIKHVSANGYKESFSGLQSEDLQSFEMSAIVVTASIPTSFDKFEVVPITIEEKITIVYEIANK